MVEPVINGKRWTGEYSGAGMKIYETVLTGGLEGSPPAPRSLVYDRWLDYQDGISAEFSNYNQSIKSRFGSGTSGAYAGLITEAEVGTATTQNRGGSKYLRLGDQDKFATGNEKRYVMGAQGMPYTDGQRNPINEQWFEAQSGKRVTDPLQKMSLDMRRDQWGIGIDGAEAQGVFYDFQPAPPVAPPPPPPAPVDPPYTPPKPTVVEPPSSNLKPSETEKTKLVEEARGRTPGQSATILTGPPEEQAKPSIRKKRLGNTLLGEAAVEGSYVKLGT